MGGDEPPAASSGLVSVAAPLLPDIYEAALRPAHWATVLERVVEFFRGRGAILRTFEATPQTAGLWYSSRIERWALQEYVSRFQPLDVWEGRARERGFMRAGSVFNSDMILPRNEFLASEFYRGFLVRQDIRELLGFVLHDGETAPMPLTVLSLFRSHREPLFGPEELLLAGELQPHLSRAVELNFQFAELRHRAALHAAALEQFAPAMAFFNRAGTLVNMNRAASLLLGAGDGIQNLNGQLFATAPADNARLQRLLRSSDQALTGEEAVVRISRPSGRLSYVAVRISLPKDTQDPPDVRRAQSAVLLHDPDTAQALDLDTLASLYGLTPAERRLVQLLVDQGSAKLILRNTDLNENTVRSQLKAVLKKTGTRAQAELVRLALTVTLRPRH